MRSAPCRMAATAALALFVTAANSGTPAPTGHDQCGSCHGADVAGSDDSPTRPDSLVCVSCHGPSTLQSNVAGTHDMPAHYSPDATEDAGNCLTCHDPHAAGPGFRLREIPARDATQRDLDPVSRLCASCHAETASFFGGRGTYSRHPVGVPVPGGAPATDDDPAVPVVDVRGTEDRRDDVVSCITCHTVHERRALHLLRWRGRDRLIAACTSCHAIGGEPRGAALLTALSRVRGQREISAAGGDTLARSSYRIP